MEWNPMEFGLLLQASCFLQWRMNRDRMYWEVSFWVLILGFYFIEKIRYKTYWKSIYNRPMKYPKDPHLCWRFNVVKLEVQIWISRWETSLRRGVVPAIFFKLTFDPEEFYTFTLCGPRHLVLGGLCPRRGDTSP